MGIGVGDARGAGMRGDWPGWGAWVWGLDVMNVGCRYEMRFALGLVRGF